MKNTATKAPVAPVAHANTTTAPKAPKATKVAKAPKAPAPAPTIAPTASTFTVDGELYSFQGATTRQGLKVQAFLSGRNLSDLSTAIAYGRGQVASTAKVAVQSNALSKAIEIFTKTGNGQGLAYLVNLTLGKIADSKNSKVLRPCSGSIRDFAPDAGYLELLFSWAGEGDLSPRALKGRQSAVGRVLPIFQAAAAAYDEASASLTVSKVKTANARKTRDKAEALA